jgi:hypothetical protein
VVKSKYILDILNFLLDGDNEGLAASQQLPFITEDTFDYTGGGLFVRFSHSDEIANYKVSKPDLILNGVKIQTTEYPIEADATLFFSNGVIDFLEIWCYQGEYPNQDLTKYTLTQIWSNSSIKTITTEN